MGRNNIIYLKYLCYWFKFLVENIGKMSESSYVISRLLDIKGYSLGLEL